MKTKLVCLIFAMIGIGSCKKSEEKTLELLEKDSLQQSLSRDHLEALMSKTDTEFPSYNPNFPPPPNAKPIFQLSQAYPKTLIVETYPWQSIDFKTKPNAYIKSVLAYCLEGNVDVDFRGQFNTVRKWYHAPWMHDDGTPNGAGREYHHGLTRERGTPEFEIHDKQDVRLENWAVGMYNAPGGLTIGNVWTSPNVKPDPTKANFPEGTVSFKLLFTDGAVDKVPFLEGSFQWQANIYRCGSNACREQGRTDRTVSLLQIDVAIKDKRALKTGWVFGTFIYDASVPGDNAWQKMVPVGLSWGDDATVIADLNKDGAFVNNSLKETYLNKSLIVDSSKTYTNEAYIKYHGLGGRLNGPVDNPISSCISCHGQAGINDQGQVLPMANFKLTRPTFPVSEFDKYFANIAPGPYVRTFESAQYNSLDYSLQLSAGIRNYYQNEMFKNSLAKTVAVSNKSMDSLSLQDVKDIKDAMVTLPEVSRGEAKQ